MKGAFSPLLTPAISPPRLRQRRFNASFNHVAVVGRCRYHPWGHFIQTPTRNRCPTALLAWLCSSALSGALNGACFKLRAGVQSLRESSRQNSRIGDHSAREKSQTRLRFGSGYPRPPDDISNRKADIAVLLPFVPLLAVGPRLVSTVPPFMIRFA